MKSYYIPRNYKGEGRILYIFSTKAIIYTAVGVGIGLIFYFLFNLSFYFFTFFNYLWKIALLFFSIYFPCIIYL